MTRFLCNTCQPRNFWMIIKYVLSDWPPQSTDLNIVENLWQTLKRNVHKQFPTNSVDLWSGINGVQDEWNKIPEDYIIKPYESIPSRLDAVIGSTSY